ncbi:methylated-DNA--[protein]-cysteine S-methyltransferase [Clostridium sp. MSJ-11]|uniref:Methylated-DNA--protein-cysteine methyltransferase n=1 Tax=Clostridium mobile TaxID=2841512 RepID=A0ABS6EDF0_9CLOT|nr:methylated-DNA--[protein]-cysteine S-methyltransferase [Clostridium mobile]MBU5483224.1 methylated-DNA--[protein]-cysteine S-methyltransferase [Clostridium mobile]
MIKKYYGYYHSPIGILEIICSEDKLLSVMVIDKEKPRSESNLILENTIIQLDEYFNGNRKEFDLKISLEGTDFQKQIWSELMKIPYGRTLSYKELAIKIGNEKAVRAVGNANGRNIIWVIVPCHRVIGTNGSLTGYAGGLGVKQWLLEHEKSFVNLK